jgi:hypothetical protein
MGTLPNKGNGGSRRMMRVQINHTRSIDRGMIVPTAEIEAFLALGWRLADEPTCGGARIVIHRVPINHKKMRAERVASLARKNCCDDEIISSSAKRTQGR